MPHARRTTTSLLAAVVAALVLGTAAPSLAGPAEDDALIKAVYNGDYRGMQRALRRGASFNARDENGYTPLHWAAFRGFGVLASYMLERGATVDVPDVNGYTPLMLAGWNGHDTVVRLLVRRGASRERRSGDGFTAWDYARSAGHTELRPLLEPRAGVPGPRFTPTRPVNTPKPITDEEPFEGVPTPAPLPTKAPPGGGLGWNMGSGPGNEFTAVAGMHLSKVSFPIAGIHYRRSLHDWFSIRLGAEYGRTQAPKTGALELGFTRLHASLLTNGWVYGGFGATHVTLGTLYAGGYNPSVFAYEAIAGVRLGYGMLAANGEFRFGIGGPSTALGGVGLRF